MQIVEMKNNQPMTTSKIVADMFKVKGGHRYITKKISDIVNANPEFGALNYLRSSYKSKQNKKLECYEMTKDGFMFVAMGLTGREADKWKIKFINAFNLMTNELVSQAKNKSSMQLLNEATKMMECDKAIASDSGKQLNEWKKKKKEHIDSIKNIVDDAQLKLGFDI